MGRKNGIIFTVMLLIGSAIFYWSMRTVNMVKLLHDLAHANWWWFIVAVIAMLIYLVMEAAIVKVFVDTQHEKLNWYNALRVPLVEQFGNGITPFATGGQPMQMFAMAQAGVDAGRAGSILLMKFVVFQGMIVINFLIALVISFHYIEAKVHALSLLLILGFLVHLAVITLLLLVMYWPKLTESMVKLVLWPLKRFRKTSYTKWSVILADKISNFHDESQRMGHNGLAIGKAIVLTFIQLFFYYLIPYFVLLGLGVQHINVVLVTAFNVLIFMIISLFPIPGGTGGAEASFQVVFSTFLSSQATLVLAMLIWRFITYYLGMFLGIIALNMSVKKDT
ncbi:MAG: flippase-like domain-containing protein [Lactobacillaceae bacterium]|jgi:uncharacterized protein (TIRG00374 family)|nr:flippase-like domain-containing protein [Lactobacillaceae bacterium]